MLVDLLLTIFLSAVIVLIPLFGYSEKTAYINDVDFRKIKVKKFKFLFRTISSEDKVDKQGVIVAIFIHQLLSYPLALATLVYGIVCIALGLSPRLVCAIIGVTQLLVAATIDLILSILSKRIKDIKEKYEFENSISLHNKPYYLIKDEIKPKRNWQLVP